MIDYSSLSGATVCVCAPTRAMREITDLEIELGRAGASVLTPVPRSGGGESPYQRIGLALNQRKIASSDAVIVANPGGYVGTGIGAEIAYALRSGIPVHLLTEPPLLELEPQAYTALLSRTKTMEIRPLLPELGEVSIGTLLAFADGPAPAARRAWCRVVDVHRYTDRHELADAVDADRVQSGLGKHGLLAVLEQRYPQMPDGWPGTAAAFVAIELEFLGELDPGREEAGAARRARYRTAADAGLLVRDRGGNVLLVPAPGPVGGWRLPGGSVHRDELPRQAAGRAAVELLEFPVLAASLTSAALMPAIDLLVVDHLAEETNAEALTQYVFDGGVIDLEHAQHLQAVTAQSSKARFAPPDEISGLVAPRLARRIAAALARLADPTAPISLEHGYAPGTGPDWRWGEGDRLPEHLPVRQVAVWAFDRDGRVLLQHRQDAHRFALPGGRLEPADRSLVETAAKEALEESQVIIDQAQAVVFGYQTTRQDPNFPDGLVQVRVAAPITGYLPIAPDADPELAGSRAPYRRYLVDVERAAELLDYGEIGSLQAAWAAETAREMLGIPVDRPAADGYRDHGDISPDDCGHCVSRTGAQ